MAASDSQLVKYPKLVDFENSYHNPEEKAPVVTRLKGAVRKRISRFNVKHCVFSYLPILETIRKYKVKEYLPNDIIAGTTAGVMMIPQGMAFAALSTLPTIVGLYISFFASITYVIFGTGRQLSWGCIAILSLMVANILDKYEKSVNGDQVTCSNGTGMPLVYNDTDPVATNGSAPGEEQDTLTEAKIVVASSVSVIVGFLLIVTSQLGLSRITNLMSNSLITGFTVGISFHVATSQLQTMLGVSVPRSTGLASIVQTWVKVLIKIPHTNVATLITSVICIVLLYLIKTCINDRFKKQMRVPFPGELFVVIVATLISKYAFLHDEFKVSVVGRVPVGLPGIKFPEFVLVKDYIADGIVIIVIAYAQTLAMAKTMGLKHNYVVDSNQEMLACGICSVVCGLFSGYVSAASVSRSVVQDGAGGRTQIASLFAAGIVLLVIMLIGPYFYFLPKCVLAAIIVVNLRSMFLKLLDIPKEWRKSKYDCAVWVFACVATIIFNADYGLLAGVTFSLLLIVLRTMLTPVVEAGQIQTSPLTVELRSLDNYSSVKKIKNVVIIKIKTPLYFVNADIFTSKVFSKSGINPAEVKKQLKEKLKNGVVASEQGESKSLEVANGKLLTEDSLTPEVKVVLLDAAEVAFIDLMGVQALEFVINELTTVGVEVLISSVPENILPMLKSTGFWEKHGERLFLSVESALASVVLAVSSVEEMKVEENFDC
ncbi:sulfate transporter-like [Physella acuta]|uniref:sulfate transporter-like n=1 Tax=Physella acuta TaxID=109671 RepID=UPI0027DD4FEE|nr:sulfate transporter-like [Physella acuta]